MRGIAPSLAVAACLLALGAGASAQTLLETDLAGTEAYRFPLPLPAGFRLSGGVAVNGNQVAVNALANGTGTLTVNRVTWSEGGSVPLTHLGLKDMAPYGGLGYTKTYQGGFKLSWDAGALFGAPTVPRPLMLGLPENLAVQNDYLESHIRAVAIEPVAELTLSLKF